MKRYQRQAGQYVPWFRFDQAATEAAVTGTYDTGPGRTWYPAVTIPVVIGEYIRAQENFDDDGLYLVDRVHFVISYDQFFRSGIQNPDPTGQDHLNDRVAFDGSLFSIDRFLPQGRVADRFLTISADGREVAKEELDEDAVASMFAPYLSAF